MQWVRETEIASWQFLSAVKGCVGCSERMCWTGVMWGRPCSNSHCFSSIDFGRNLPDTELDIEGCWPPLLPWEMGSQGLHWRLFPIDFKSACCNTDHINLAGWRQQSSTTADTMAWAGCIWGAIHLQQLGCNPGVKFLWQMTQAIGNFQKQGCFAGVCRVTSHNQRLQAKVWAR